MLAALLAIHLLIQIAQLVYIYIYIYIQLQSHRSNISALDHCASTLVRFSIYCTRHLVQNPLYQV